MIHCLYTCKYWFMFSYLFFIKSFSDFEWNLIYSFSWLIAISSNSFLSKYNLASLKAKKLLKIYMKRLLSVKIKLLLHNAYLFPGLLIVSQISAVKDLGFLIGIMSILHFSNVKRKDDTLWFNFVYPSQCKCCFTWSRIEAQVVSDTFINWNDKHRTAFTLLHVLLTCVIYTVIRFIFLCDRFELRIRFCQS